MKQEATLINRELSWLSFNDRVLQEAEDHSVPLIERIKFLGIFSNNNDEFFRVRVATLTRLARMTKPKDHYDQESPSLVLEQVYKALAKQELKFDSIYKQLISELEKQHIFFINETKVTAEQGAFIKNFFWTQVMPLIFPVILNEVEKFPSMKDSLGYLLVKLVRKGTEKKEIYALIEIPSDSISRFLVLPKSGDKEFIIFLDDVIRYCLKDVFRNFQYDHIEAFSIKITRDAELDLDNDISKNFVEKLSKGLKDRKKGRLVSFVYDKDTPKNMLRFVEKKIGLGKKSRSISGGRYLNFREFMGFPKIGKPEFYNTKTPHVVHPDLPNRDKDGRQSYFDIVRQKDVLLCYPYHSFEHIVDFIREASIDPKVVSIKITLYRVAKKANLIKALINAIKNGKKVTVLLEVKARFDEEANISWANELEEEGATVIYGVPGLKVHSKLFLIKRVKDGVPELFAHVGTGNFNSDTAGVYTDIALLTCDKRITHEISKTFDFYSNNLKINSYKHLLVSPFYLRRELGKLIKKEMEHAKNNEPASIIIKVNNLVDKDLIEKLYEASSCGVKIRVIVRGICALVAGIKGLSENIEAISIVDKYLEHSRIFIFHNKGNEKCFLSSADWMKRNLDFRSEVAVPIYDEQLKAEIKSIVELIWADNVKARILDSSESNQRRNPMLKYTLYGEPTPTKEKIRSQDAIYEYIKSLSQK